MIGAGFPAQQAQSFLGLVVPQLVAAGTTQATAKGISGDVVIFTTVAASSGGVLPPSSDDIVAGDHIFVANFGANALNVYPPVGGAINNGSANAAVSLAVGKTAHLISLGYGNWLMQIGA